MAKRRAEFEIRGDASKLAADLRNASDRLRRAMDSSARASEKSWKRASSNIQKSFENTARGISRSFRTLKKTLSSPITLAFGGIGGAAAVGKLSDLAASRKQIENIGAAVTGSDLLAGKEIAFATQLADKYGLSLNETRKAYLKLLASAAPANFEIEESRKIFESVSSASTALGLSMDETRGAYRAIEQIMSKGTVQAEELRGQLGERLPGAFSIAAKAMGVTTQELGKMMEQGQLLANDFLPKFAAELEATFGGAAIENASLWTRELRRIGNAFSEFFGSSALPFFEGVSPAIMELGTQIERVFDPVKAANWGQSVVDSVTKATVTLSDVDLGQILVTSLKEAWVDFTMFAVTGMVRALDIIQAAFRSFFGWMKIQALEISRDFVSMLSPADMISPGSPVEQAVEAINAALQSAKASSQDFFTALGQGLERSDEDLKLIEDSIRIQLGMLDEAGNKVDAISQAWDAARAKTEEATKAVGNMAAGLSGVATMFNGIIGQANEIPGDLQSLDLHPPKEGAESRLNNI